MVGGHSRSCYNFENTERHYVGTDGKFQRSIVKVCFPSWQYGEVLRTCKRGPCGEILILFCGCAHEGDRGTPPAFSLCFLAYDDGPFHLTMHPCHCHLEPQQSLA